jgi:putative ABC transport system permease protein
VHCANEPVKLLILALRHLARRPRRTLLTTLTIAAATLCFAMLVAVPSSMNRIIDSAARGQRLIITNRTGPYALPVRYCNDIKKIRHITGCVPQVFFYLKYRTDSDWIGVTASTPEVLSLFPDYGVPPDTGDPTRFIREKRAASVGSLLLKKYHWKLGQQVVLRTADDRLKMPFLLVSVVPSEHYPEVFLIRWDYLSDSSKAAGGPELTQANALIARVDSIENMGAAARAIDETFHNSDAETRTQTETNNLIAGLSNVGDLRAIIATLCFVVILTVLLIAGNSMAMIVRDRIPEVALLRTLGFGPKQVGTLLFTEAALIGLFGGLLGAGLAYALFASGIDLGSITAGLGLVRVTPLVTTASFMVAILVGLVSATLPVAAALRTAPAIGLKKVI